MLGGELRRRFPAARAWDREEADVTAFPAFRNAVLGLRPRPDAIVNCVAFNDVDGAEDRPAEAFALNARFPGELAGLTAELDIPLVHFSTNYVFDGVAGEYAESDPVSPMSVYAESKAAGEVEIAGKAPKHYIVRTAVIFGRRGESDVSKKSFVEIMLDLSARTSEVRAVSDEVNSVTYAPDLASAVRSLLEGRRPYGTYHATNSGAASWYDFAREIFAVTGREVRVIPVPSSAFPRKARRPARAILLNTKLPPLRSWQAALVEFLRQL
jgi:dTDP-4-dehydrorhamnose reductase